MTALWWATCTTRAGGFEVGFKVRGLSALDVDAEELAEIWAAPLFDAPMLGLSAVPAGEIIVAAGALFRGRASVNHEFFMRAVESSGEQALEAWLCCLESGDAMGHYGLGRTLLRLGRAHEAYRHLRYYTGLAPEGSWAWCSYGRAADALGHDGEARDAYCRAIELEDAGAPHTSARELLVLLERRRGLRGARRRR